MSLHGGVTFLVVAGLMVLRALAAAAAGNGVASGTGAPVLRVQAEPGSESCRQGHPLELALRQRMPEVRVVAGGVPNEHDLLVALHRGDRTLRLEVTRPSGELVMSRALAEGACEAVASVSAVIVERFLASIRWSGRPVTIEGFPAEQTAELAPKRRLLAFGVSTGPMAMARLPGHASAGFSVEGSVDLGGRLRGSLWVGGNTEREQSARREGQVRGALLVRDFVALATAAFCGQAGRLTACAGAGAGGLVVLASSRGEALHRKRAGRALLPAPSTFVRLAVRRPSGFELSASVAALFPIGSSAFEIEGADAKYRTPRAQLGLGLAVGWVFQ